MEELFIFVAVDLCVIFLAVSWTVSQNRQRSWRVISPRAGTEVHIITAIFLRNCPCWFIVASFHSAREWRAIQHTFMFRPVWQSCVDKKCWKSAKHLCYSENFKAVCFQIYVAFSWYRASYFDDIHDSLLE